MCVHNLTMFFPKSVADEINGYLEKGGLKEEETITYTAMFIDGTEMDINIIGHGENPASAEAVLYNCNGMKETSSKHNNNLIGDWKLGSSNDIYCVSVSV